MKKLIILVLLLNAQHISGQDLPIFTENLKAGVYQTYEEFKFNAPSITDSIFVELIARKTEPWKSTFQPVPRYADNNKKIKKVWGFCDGEKAYCFHQLEFFEIDLSDHRSIFFGYGEMNKNSGATGAIVGGAIGYSIEQAASVAKVKKQKIAYHINLANGEIKKLDDIAYDAKFVQPDVYVVFYRYGKKEIDEAVTVTVNDSILISLENYSYDQIKLQVSNNPVKIDFGDGEIFLYVPIMTEENKYVEVSNSKDSAKEKLVLWDDVTGDFYAKKAKNRQLKREGDE